MRRVFHENRLLQNLRDEIKVDTPERWQGLERKMMIIVHPLSGNISQSSFDLQIGRLCVMASLHQAGLIIVSRDHIMDTLDSYYPVADHPFYEYDINGRWYFLATIFWGTLMEMDGVVV